MDPDSLKGVPWIPRRYREACEGAQAAVVGQLQALAFRLQAHLRRSHGRCQPLHHRQGRSAPTSPREPRSNGPSPPCSSTPSPSQNAPGTRNPPFSLMPPPEEDAPVHLCRLWCWRASSPTGSTQGRAVHSTVHRAVQLMVHPTVCLAVHSTAAPASAFPMGTPNGVPPSARAPVVRNDVHMPAMFLLTGPDGGRSSLLRSICAASLLASCGLMVPATAAQVRLGSYSTVCIMYTRTDAVYWQDSPEFFNSLHAPRMCCSAVAPSLPSIRVCLPLLSNPKV